MYYYNAYMTNLLVLMPNPKMCIFVTPEAEPISSGTSMLEIYSILWNGRSFWSKPVLDMKFLGISEDSSFFCC